MKEKLNEILEFEQQRSASIKSYANDTNLKKSSIHLLTLAFRHRYMYNFESLGSPVIQIPVVMVAMQEIIWQVRPDLIVEFGFSPRPVLSTLAELIAGHSTKP